MENEVRFMRQVLVAGTPVQQMEFLGDYICLAFVDRLIDTGNSLVKARAIRPRLDDLNEQQILRIETSYRFVYAMRGIHSLGAARDYILSYPTRYGSDPTVTIDIQQCLFDNDTDQLEDFLAWYASGENRNQPHRIAVSSFWTGWRE